MMGKWRKFKTSSSLFVQKIRPWIKSAEQNTRLRFRMTEANQISKNKKLEFNYVNPAAVSP